MTAQLGLADAVAFRGQLAPKDYAPLLAGADMGLSPYCNWPEYSGLKILDYKAAGLATITSGQDGRPRTVEDGRTGLIVPPCDEDALANTMVRLATDRELRRQMGRAARVQAEQCHRWSDTVANLEAVFAGVLSPHGVRRPEGTTEARDGAF